MVQNREGKFEHSQVCAESPPGKLEIARGVGGVPPTAQNHWRHGGDRINRLLRKEGNIDKKVQVLYVTRGSGGQSAVGMFNVMVKGRYNVNESSKSLERKSTENKKLF